VLFALELVFGIRFFQHLIWIDAPLTQNFEIRKSLEKTCENFVDPNGIVFQSDKKV
jgi:hypothetical protein